MKTIFIMLLLLLLVLSSIVEARFHFHKKQKKTSTISQTPAASPPEFPSDPVSDPVTDPSDCVFDVTDYGAIGDGSTDDTAAFVAAWKEACAVESATVLVPSGCSFMITSTIFSGPCKPGLVFQVDGILTPPAGPDCWPKKDSNKQWLVFYKLNNMTLTGTGTIEGNGNDWWNLPCKPHKVKVMSSSLRHNGISMMRESAH